MVDVALSIGFLVSNADFHLMDALDVLNRCFWIDRFHGLPYIFP